MPKKVRGIYMHLLSIARIVVITLVIGWLSAAVVAGGLALLQYQEIVRYYPADQVAAQFQAHLDREVWRGSLLLFVQIGVVGGMLWWQINRARVPTFYGLVGGVVVALIEGWAGWWLQMPKLFLVPLVISLIVVGWAAGNYNDHPISTP